jgi:hypothetical protein
LLLFYRCGVWLGAGTIGSAGGWRVVDGPIGFV